MVLSEYLRFCFPSCKAGRAIKLRRNPLTKMKKIFAKHGLRRRHLSEGEVRFHVRWEDICCLRVVQMEQASILRGYLANKTLSLLPAFDLERAGMNLDFFAGKKNVVLVFYPLDWSPTALTSMSASSMI
jgi:hypothetical protein